MFPPNPRTHGGSSWFLETRGGGLLVDTPPDSEATFAFLEARAQASPGWIVLLGRDGHGSCRRVQERMGWPVLVQEQEAYLLPGLPRLESFARDHQLAEGVDLLWTPGPSPGACVVHVRRAGWDGLFCGRLLVPLAPGRLGPLRHRRSFHWSRQLESVERLRRWLPAGSPEWVATGAGLGALRGEKLVAAASQMLRELDLEELRRASEAPLGAPSTMTDFL
ncbi:MAG: MBL fold metallo-hydrolase [Cyanobacteriota bacterium]